MSRLDAIGQRVAGMRIRYEVARETIAKEKASLKEDEERLAAAKEAQAILQEVAQGVQREAHERIAGLVSSCLAACFDDPYEFHVEFTRKRGRTEAELYFTRGGNRFEKTQVGGGVLDVAGFALRLACLLLTRPSLRRVLILDEPFKNLHGAENRHRARRMMETLPKELGVQIIMSTGLEWLEIGKIINIDEAKR